MPGTAAPFFLSGTTGTKKLKPDTESGAPLLLCSGRSGDFCLECSTSWCFWNVGHSTQTSPLLAHKPREKWGTRHAKMFPTTCPTTTRSIGSRNCNWNRILKADIFGKRTNLNSFSRKNPCHRGFPGPVPRQLRFTFCSKAGTSRRFIGCAPMRCGTSTLALRLRYM